jgi:hypothetical protein
MQKYKLLIFYFASKNDISYNSNMEITLFGAKITPLNKKLAWVKLG